MRKRFLGNSKLEVSEVGLGTWALGGPVTYQGYSVGWRPIDENEAVATIQATAACGINFIDTADIYGQGRAETYIGKSLKSMGRDGQDMIVATKVGFDLEHDRPIGQNQNFSEEYILSSCEKSLKRLQRDWIDLYQLHCVPLPVIEKGEVFEVLENLKNAGKIREYGVSIVRDDEALAAMEYPGVRSIQIIFNIFRQKPIRTVFSKAKERGVGILARVPLASGLLTGKFKPGHQFEKGDHRSEGIPGETFSGVSFQQGLVAVKELKSLEKKGERTLAQAALSYTLSFDAVSITIPGAVNPQQVNENARAGSLPLLGGGDLGVCESIYQKYFQKKMEKLF